MDELVVHELYELQLVVEAEVDELDIVLETEELDEYDEALQIIEQIHEMVGILEQTEEMVGLGELVLILREPEVMVEIDILLEVTDEHEDDIMELITLDEMVVTEEILFIEQEVQDELVALHKAARLHEFDEHDDIQDFEQEVQDELDDMQLEQHEVLGEDEEMGLHEVLDDNEVEQITIRTVLDEEDETEKLVLLRLFSLLLVLLILQEQ